MSTFPQILKQQRETSGLSQPDLAKKSGVPQRSISNYETGRSDPSWSAVQKIARALGVSCEVFKESLPDIQSSTISDVTSETELPAPPAKSKKKSKRKK